ncbi:MAG: DUF1822 family protein [Leptolyngbyaceae cyanobacterium bins.302]|nr:DUF1822 family protein [Leptolyngbyaceae cyanobacterium bins.302]
MLTFETSTQWLDIPEAIHQECWQQSQTLTVPSHRWQAYLNQVCLNTILPWLQEKSGMEPSMVASLDTPEFWQWVNGSVVRLGETRLILVPTEAIDPTELRIPQEWVDILDWIGDYYLAVAVDTDEQVLQIWGYTTHQQLKSQGRYDASDRTYSITGEWLIRDLAVFWVMQQLPPEPTRAEIPALPELSSSSANSLMQQLKNSENPLPQLDIPFEQWGALLQHDRWLHQLRQPRQAAIGQQMPQDQPTTIVQLSQWLQNLFEAGWLAIADGLAASPDLAFSLRGEPDSPASVQRIKHLQLGDGLPNVRVVVGVDTEADGRRRIEVRVLPDQSNAVLPANLTLRMQSTTGETVQVVTAGNQSRYIQLRRFKCAPGMTFRLQITVAGVSVTEDFVA